MSWRKAGELLTSYGALGLVLSLVSGCTCSSAGDSETSPLADGGAGEGGLYPWDGSTAGITITPASLDLTVDPGSGTATSTQFTVHGAGSATVRWRVTNPALGTIDQSGVFTPAGDVGGEGDVEVTVGDVTVKVHITVTVEHLQNGGGVSTTVDAGAGGLGGVGGEGLGGAVPDALRAALEGAAAADPSISWLYPYDATVFPLGILPPLLQWSDGSQGDFEAVYIHLSAPPYYDYRGFFGRPGPLPAGSNFVRHPIPRSVWDAATRSAAGGSLTAEIVLASGGKAYGPLRQSYKIALAPFNGTVYYQAYNTALAHNYESSTISGLPMGGATLSIGVGAEAPTLVAGTTTTDSSGCRVCHSVSAYGDRMIVQHGDAYDTTSAYDLKNGNTESPYGTGLAWAGLYPDGRLGLANTVSVGNTGEVGAGVGLYDMTTGALVPSTGLDTFATSVGLPAFSPDGKRAAFVLFEGPSTPAIGTPDGRKLVLMDFDLASKAFSNPVTLWETAAGDERPAWSTFLPSSGALVFQRRWDGSTNELFGSRYGARGELWWVDLASGSSVAMDRVNGVGYLPRSADGHQEDERLNYEPSISPVASGGYAWMVFMSRRLYGNVATTDPFHSDPRDYDLDRDITTKKIWMAAIDLNPEPGKDPSHPAFYIPGQELRGANSRPFFALQPCLSDRGTCTTGVDCCSGFCREGFCVPRPADQCSEIDEKCAVDGDCCDSRAQCIGGFCAVFIQ